MLGCVVPGFVDISAMMPTGRDDCGRWRIASLWMAADALGSANA
jgi:hypothetical protein